MNILLYLPRELLELTISLLDISSEFSLGFIFKPYASGDKFPIAAIDSIDHNYLDVFKWIMHMQQMQGQMMSQYRYQYCKAAARVGSLEILKLVYDDVYAIQNHFMVEAAVGGHLGIIKWLHEHRCRINNAICEKASGNGRINILEWLYERNYFYSYQHRMCHIKAAKYGQLDVFKWFKTYNTQHKIKYDMGGEQSCWHAVKYGHFELLKWLHENGCPWNEASCNYAAENGRLDILKYLRENDCPWCEYTWEFAIVGGHLDVLKWIYANGCPIIDNAYDLATNRNQHEIASWLQENGLV